MARVKKSLTARTKHKKVLKSTKGHYGARRKLFKTAKQSYIKALQYSFRDRKNRKRDFRSLWISRINAAAREHGLSYSILISKMKNTKIKLNRKVLADIATKDVSTFKKVVETALK